jgi:hypothetical protein
MIGRKRAELIAGLARKLGRVKPLKKISGGDAVTR